MLVLFLGLLTLLVTACGSTPAAIGDRVAIHYQGTLDDGSVFDSSLERTPLEFVIGSGELLQGFEEAVQGLVVDGSALVRIPPAEAYGQIDANAPQPVDLSLLPPEIAVGDQMDLGTGNIARVVSIEGDRAMVVINHVLAGQALTFWITLIEIK